MADELVAGLYERLLTATLHDSLPDRLDLAALTGAVEAADEPVVLTRYLAGIIHDALLQQRDPAQRLELANGLLQHLHHTDQVLAPPGSCCPLHLPRSRGGHRYRWCGPPHACPTRRS